MLAFPDPEHLRDRKCTLVRVADWIFFGGKIEYSFSHNPHLLEYSGIVCGGPTDTIREMIEEGRVQAVLEKVRGRLMYTQFGEGSQIAERFEIKDGYVLAREVLTRPRDQAEMDKIEELRRIFEEIEALGYVF